MKDSLNIGTNGKEEIKMRKIFLNILTHDFAKHAHSYVAPGEFRVVVGKNN